MSQFNILILAAGAAHPEEKASYPLCVTEIDGVPLLERIVGHLKDEPPARFHYAFQADEIRRFHLDNLVQVLTPGASLIPVQRDTKGSAATALMAMSTMDPEAELLIVSANELVSTDLSSFVRQMRARELDAATLTFRSVHPRYSYVRLDHEGLVAEAAQRNPISHHATTGVFWFRHTGRTMAAIQSMIRKGADHEGQFYVAPAFNELLLQHARIGVMPLESKDYQPVKDGRDLHRVDVAQHA